ncbi:MAG: polyprenyl synthetase family protein, partial [Lachnospiraceae bacterium]|nr:polyprenyl synthetase family protein [Lachnospiraceae bacterium]
VGAGGKRLRPVMMQAAYELCGGKGTVVEYFMAALEMIHNYSLVHDDLPEMDNVNCAAECRPRTSNTVREWRCWPETVF